MEWFRRRWKADAALDTTMGTVVEYYQYSCMKAPPRPDEAATDSASSPSPSPFPSPRSPSTPSSLPQPALTAPAASLSLPESGAASFDPLTSSAPLTYAKWQSEREEMRRLDQCALKATRNMLAAGASTGVITLVYRFRGQSSASRIGSLLQASGVFLLTAAVAWRVWGKRCAEEFLQTEGRVADRARAVMRREMPDHPMLQRWDSSRPVRLQAQATQAAGDVGVKAAEDMSTTEKEEDI